VEVGGGAVDGFGEAAAVGVVGVGGDGGWRGLAGGDVFESSEAIVAAVVEEFLLSCGFVGFSGEIAVWVVGVEMRG